MKPLVFILLLCSCAAAQEFPNSPSFDRQLWTATAIHGAVRIADDVITCQHLANGGIEGGYPTQSCAGVVALNSATFAAFTFASYEFAKHGHRKIAVALQYVGGGTDAVWLSTWYWHGGKGIHP